MINYFSEIKKAIKLFNESIMSTLGSLFQNKIF